VNAPALAAARGIVVDERTCRREHGFPDTLEVAAATEAPASAASEFTVEGTVLHGTSPRTLAIDGIPLEAPLEGTILFTRNRDVPGVIGQMGTALGNCGVNIATFSLGRRAHGGEALALVGLDGEVPESVLQPIRAIPAVLEAKLVRLPE
jgi:D-3-phosphoglycerate dehydrogenase